MARSTAPPIRFYRAYETVVQTCPPQESALGIVRCQVVGAAAFDTVICQLKQESRRLVVIERARFAAAEAVVPGPPAPATSVRPTRRFETSQKASAGVGWTSAQYAARRLHDPAGCAKC
jgi:hypothetical protein